MGKQNCQDARRNNGRKPGEPGEPTERELAALRAMVRYGTTGAAAEKLFLSPVTCQHHLRSLRRKSGFRHLHQVVLWAYKKGLLEDEDEVQTP